MLSKNSSIRFVIAAFSFILVLTHAARSQDTLDRPPPPPKYGEAPMSQIMEPTTTPYGTAGMTNVISAEPLGDGRVGMQLRANFYNQSKTEPLAPSKNAQITTATFGAALGINPYIDGFVGMGAYNVRNSTADGSGAGTAFLGAQGTLPLPENVPVRLGLQVASLFGIAGKQINTNRADGYNYLETRKGTDVMARLVQSFVFAGEDLGIKLHLNEGVVSSFEKGKDVLLVTGLGAQFIVMPPLVLGAEINSRTFLAKPLTSDPLWITPSMTLRTPAHLNLGVGVDFSLSKDRAGTVDRALEPWRAFASVSIAYDTQADKKLREAEKARQDSLDRIALRNRANNAENSKDSLTMASAAERARQQAIADSIAAKARQDSINLASSLAASQSSLAASQASLTEERSKRSEAEKQLLSTGMLLLDAVYFETAKTDISINSKPYLNIIAKMLTKYPKLQIEVAGHTDNVGSHEYNIGLSQGRSASVMNYMQMVEPSLQGHLTARGYAFDRPKATNSTAEGRKFNRRTELEVMNKEVLKEYNP